jgi:hypothetical protein cresD4_01395
MKKLKASVVALLSVALLSACGNLPNPLGKSQDSSTEQTSTATDAAGTTSAAPAAFNTGGFKTEPHNALPDPTPETGRASEAFLMGEYVPLPYEVDPILEKGQASRPVTETRDLRVAFTSSEINAIAPLDNKLQSGFYNAAEKPRERPFDPTFSATQTLLRYDSPETAQEVAQKLYEDDIAPKPEGAMALPYQPDSVAGMPNSSYVMSYVAADTGAKSYNTLTTYNEYVIITYASAPPGQEQWSRDYVKKAYNQQVPLLEQFPGIKTAAGYGKSPTYPPHDPNNIIIYAVWPREEDQPDWPGTLGPRATAGAYANSKEIYNTMTQQGATHNGKNMSFVFRANNDFGAQAILNSFMSSDLQIGAKEYPEPQGVPDTKCVVREEITGTTHSCYVTNGRYLAQVVKTTVSSKPEEKAKQQELVSQMVAAQYEILKKADQKIENIKN